MSSLIEHGLYVLSEFAAHASGQDSSMPGYGTRFENDVFRMHPYCWCDRDDCEYCSGDAPNFLHKPTGASVSWYKYIGRGMEASEADWRQVFADCMASLAK